LARGGSELDPMRENARAIIRKRHGATTLTILL
jgi:hypothetical protein